MSLKQESNCSYRNPNLPRYRECCQKGILNFNKTWPETIWLVSASWWLKAGKVADPQIYLESLGGRKIGRSVSGSRKTQEHQLSVRFHHWTVCWYLQSFKDIVYLKAFLNISAWLVTLRLNKQKAKLPPLPHMPLRISLSLILFIFLHKFFSLTV